MDKKIISGIQQIGIGVSNVKEAWDYYRTQFGFDLKIFEEAAEAALMLPYTQNEVRSRHAILAYNIRGGGGLEIWQYTGRTPQAIGFEIKMGDLGIFANKMRSPDVDRSYEAFKSSKQNLLGEVQRDPLGRKSFWMKDPYGNVIQVVEDSYELKATKHHMGGSLGCAIGVKNIEDSIKVYKDILEYDEVSFDESASFDDIQMNGGDAKVRRVILRHSKPRAGFLSAIFGPSEIELYELEAHDGKEIFEGRDWGDLGYIHLCYDIRGMQELKAECESKGFPFTVESNPDFDMGEAAGQFSYIDAPESTLVEFVETHKIPMIKAIGWNLNLAKRDPKKPMPGWFFAALNMMRTKN